MEKLILKSYLKILNTIFYDMNITTGYMDVIDSFEGRNYRQKSSYNADTQPPKQTFFFVIPESSAFFELTTQVDLAIYTSENSIHFLHEAWITAKDKKDEFVSRENLSIYKTFNYILPIDIVSKFALYGHRTLLQNNMIILHKFIKSFLSQNEVA